MSTLLYTSSRVPISQDRFEHLPNLEHSSVGFCITKWGDSLLPLGVYACNTIPFCVQYFRRSSCARYGCSLKDSSRGHRTTFEVYCSLDLVDCGCDFGSCEKLVQSSTDEDGS